MDLLEQELNKLLGKWRSEVGKIDPQLLPLVDKFIKANQGGKRIRGRLVVLGYQLAAHLRGASLDSARDKKAHLGGEISKIAAAYEICHSAILAHDDIIDQSPVRRGQPSLYQACGQGYSGISLAICLADAGFFLSFRIIAEARFPDPEKNQALKYFSRIMLDTAAGQMLDSLTGESMVVAKHKTARYTVSGPLILGAILGRGSQGLLGKLAEFGENLGIAFQIQDDILDNEVAWIGGVDSAKKEAIKYKNRALKVLPEITKDKEMSKLLKQMAGYLVQRTK